MHITHAFAAPRLVPLGEAHLWVSPLRIADFALLAAWLDDVLPGALERDCPPSFADDAAWEKITSGEGLVHLAWASLRHQGITWDRTASMLLAASAEERAKLVEVLFARRRGMRRESDGESLSRLFWGPAVSVLCEAYHMTPEQVGMLTIDQFDMLTRDGCEDERPKGQGSVDTSDVMRMWADSRAQWEADHPEEAKDAPA